MANVKLFKQYNYLVFFSVKQYNYMTLYRRSWKRWHSFGPPGKI